MFMAWIRIHIFPMRIQDPYSRQNEVDPKSTVIKSILKELNNKQYLSVRDICEEFKGRPGFPKINLSASPKEVK